MVSARINNKRWSLRLREGPQFHRQRKAYDQMLSGQAVRGELALYERGEDLMCRLVAWPPRTERDAKQAGTLVVHTDKDSLFVAVNAKKRGALELPLGPLAPLERRALHPAQTLER